MHIRLRVTSSQAATMGADCVRQFDQKGGTIGRAAVSDWLLPDERRYISSAHAKISYSNGTWFLTDKSVNGTYINHPNKRVAPGFPSPLNQGDRIYIGDYEITVSIDREDRPEVARSPAMAWRSKAVGQSSDVTAFQAPAKESEPQTLRIRADDDATATPGHDTEQAGAARPERRKSLSGAEALALGQLLEGAGIDPSRVAELPPFSARVFGQALRKSIDHLMAMLKARSRFKRDFHLPRTKIRAMDNNPLKVFDSADEALEHLLFPQGDAYLTLVDALSDAFGDLAAHQETQRVASVAAYHALFGYFDPERLSSAWGDQPKGRGILGVGNKSGNWESYRQMYAELLKDTESTFFRLFGDEFGRAYEANIQKSTRH